MSSFRDESSGSLTVTLLGDPERHCATVILMHGLGDSAEGWEDSAQMLSSQLPHVKFILPTAYQMPVSLNGGFQMNAWYDIKGLSAESSFDCPGIEESRDRIIAIMDAEAAAGLPYNRIVLAGFSQGGAMSYFTGLQLPSEKRPAGVVVLSGYLPKGNTFVLTPGFENVPLLHCHGIADAVVGYAWGQKSIEHVRSSGLVAADFKSYPGLGHGANAEEVADVLSFLSKTVPFDESCVVKPKPFKDMSVKELKQAITKRGLTAKARGLSEKHELVNLLESSS